MGDAVRDLPRRGQLVATNGPEPQLLGGGADDEFENQVRSRPYAITFLAQGCDEEALAFEVCERVHAQVVLPCGIDIESVCCPSEPARRRPPIAAASDGVTLPTLPPLFRPSPP
jgi:hypothetical protein